MAQDRTVIVTGAAQGIGHAVAKAFKDKGEFVAIFDLNEEAATSAAENLGNAKGYQVDVVNEQNVKSTVEQVIDERGTVDVLVNNAGVQFISPVEDFPEEKWDFVVDVILKGAFLTTKHVLT
ncbi:SDR family NAD(P)-dependent oxidoreductase [Oceanobacillus rekensis]|uniref:SDR family NAD(P)-dependent oxidoreductase n=1 Tax=Oceanobacillus rekensis TaxID=937927 RepID=UPI000B44AF7D|nr:SDR family NAD(P)-dependent oxidoreductase [Oceanobacillus rekensis]